MADIRINIFDTYPHFMGHAAYQLGLTANGEVNRIAMQAFNLPGSLSFKNVAVQVEKGTGAATATFSFGLYSQTGNTLSIANSASASFGNGGLTSWVTLATSATQDITPGTWFLALMSNTAGSNNLSIGCFDVRTARIGYGGPFFRGHFASTTTAMPASIATSDMVKWGDENSATDMRAFPYILIGA